MFIKRDIASIICNMIATLLIFLLMVISFSLNKIPMALTSFLGMLFLVVLKTVSPDEAVSTLVNSTTLTIASMFIISSAVGKTSFISKLSDIVSRISGNSFRKVLASYVFVTFILAQFIPSTTAIFAIVCPLVVSMCKKTKENPAKYLYSIAIVTVTTAYTITPIGPYAANFVENNGLFSQFGIIGYPNTVFTEMLIKIPTSLAIILWAVFGAPALTPKRMSGLSDSVYSAGVGKVAAKSDEAGLSRFQEIVCYTVFITVIIGYVFNNFGMQTWIIPAFGACILVLFRILSQKEAYSNMGIEIIFLYAGTSCLGKAFANTGAGDYIGNTVLKVLGNTSNSYVLGFAVFTAAFVMTSLLYNRAVSKILIPIVLATAAALKCDPRGLIQMCYIGSMSSFITPMATSVVPMMMASGGYTQKDLLKMGIIPAVISCVVTVSVGMTMFPCW